jgi:HSP20 family protein
MSTSFLKLIEEFDSMFGRDSFPNYNLKGRLNNGNKVLGFNSNIPSTNVFEDEWSYKYEIITPGISKENISIEINGEKENLSIEINGETLTFKGERKIEKTEKGDYVSKEYHYNKFYRTFEIPTNVVSEEIYAKTENGITTIYLPKEKPTKTKSYSRKVSID